MQIFNGGLKHCLGLPNVEYRGCCGPSCKILTLVSVRGTIVRKFSTSRKAKTFRI